MDARERSSGNAEPRADRPRLGDDHESSPTESLLPWSWAEERLRAAHTYWICTVTPDRRPHTMPVWGVWYEGALYFGTSRRSRKARNLAANPRVAVHVESGDEAVIVEGEAIAAADGPELQRAATAYAAKYTDPDSGEGVQLTEGVPDTATVYRVRPARAFGFREHDFPRSATRWSFAAG